MITTKKSCVLLIVFAFFAVFIFAVFFPATSWAEDIGPGDSCSDANTINYQTECTSDPDRDVGSCHDKCCKRPCDSWDDDGNCTGCDCSRECRDCSCNSQSWNEYKASSEDCEAIIQIRECHVEHGGTCTRPSCPGTGNCTGEECCVVCSGWDDCEQCGSWQKAERTCCVTKIGLDKPECKCSGGCIAAPTGLRYYDNPTYPTDPCNPEPGIGSTNIHLPVKLDWDDVEGWKDGWCSGGGYELADACGSMTTISSGGTTPWKECCIERHEACVEYESSLINWDELNACEERCKLGYIKYTKCEWQQYINECVKEKWDDPDPEKGFAGPDDECETEDCPYPNLVYNPSELVQYYEITITGEMRDDEGSAMPTFTARLGQSEFIPPNPCFFKSNREYEWSVRACCGNGECGPAATSIFTTSLAPEPVWPDDPDWAGPDRAEPEWKTPTPENPYPVHLEWCPVEEAKSYCIRMYKPGTPFIRMYGQGDPFCPPLYSELYCPAVVPPIKEAPIQSYFDFGLDVFTKETDYQWKVATCLSDELGYQCGLSCPGGIMCYTFETLKIECACCDFSQLWNFFGKAALPILELISPKDGEFVNFTHALTWVHVPGANSYRYEIKKDSSVIINETIIGEHITIQDLWYKGILALKTTYTWRVQPCWDQKGEDCQDESWSHWWEFTTTGATPTGLDVAEKDPSTGYALIPIKLNWDDMGGAASYKYEVNGPDGIMAKGIIAGPKIPPSEISINYDSGHPKQNTNYSWEVWTCADIEGNVCGSPASASLTTFELEESKNSHPTDGDKFYTNERYLQWDSVLGAAYYKYELNGETNIVSSNSAFIDTSTLGLGMHTWSVQACIDENCLEPSPNISTWSFELVEGEAPAGKGGIVPCGRYTDNPNTPWDERKHCGIQHIFIMIFSIIDFLLWKAIPIVLALLALASGVIFYFSGQLGIAEPLAQVKSLWKAAGIGLAVIFLAWTGISLILGLFGYQVGLFGDWWKISF